MKPSERERLDLRPDCARCVGLCCVAPAFAVSADFAIDKDAGQPCPHLETDFRCGIHGALRKRGFPGCAVYDCFGAGQKITQVTFGGRDWRSEPAIARPMFDAFAVVRQLHELLWYLSEALTLWRARPLRAELRAAVEETERLTQADPDALIALDLGAHRRRVEALLLRASRSSRAAAGRRPVVRRGADLIGADLGGADLAGADLRGARLIGANLRRADLRWTDLMGADLRAADLAGADLRDAVYLTPSQLASAKGDGETRLPRGRRHPAHWPRAAAPAEPQPPDRRKPGAPRRR